MNFTKGIILAPIAPIATLSYVNSFDQCQMQSTQREAIVVQPSAPPSYNDIHDGHYTPAYQPQSVTNTQPGYVPQYPGQIVITKAPTSIVSPPNFTNSIQPLGPHPSMTKCMNCNSQIVTTVEYYNSSRTHLAAGLLCLGAFWLCCCFLPYCLNSTKNVRHFCPNCKVLIGTFERKTC